MATKIITIPNAQVNDMLAAIQHFYPNTPGATPNEIANNFLALQLNSLLNRYKNYVAKQAVSIPLDNTIITVQ